MEDLKIKVSKIGILDMLKFKNQVKTRENVIAKGTADDIEPGSAVNDHAKIIHPSEQYLRISEIIPHGDGVKTFVFESATDVKLAPFRAGQYLSFRLDIDGSCVTRPISICSSPKQALEGKYAITVRRAFFASDYMLDKWKVGDTVIASSPLGEFYYSPLRDARHVICIAGGSGITPFLSMAQAIADGTEDFEMTLLYGSRTEELILFKDELDELEMKSGGRIKTVHVLSDEEREGYEHGFIDEQLIRKYMKGGNNSIFICGPQAMYKFVMKEVNKLGLEKKWIRRELFGASKTPWELPGYPEECRGKEYRITMTQCGEHYEFTGSADESLLVAIERAGIRTPSHCRSGECGWCRSRHISGDVFIPDSTDGRRAADKIYGYIHPCVSYPIGDIVIDVPEA